MIIVEGPDGAGKTTLIKHLMTEFPLTLAPRVVSKDAVAMVDLKQWVEDQQPLLNQGVVFDRHRLISEPIYQAALGKPTEPGFGDLGWFMGHTTVLYQKKPTIIYCMPPKDIAQATVLRDPDNSIFHTNMAAYDVVWNLYCAKIAIDYAAFPTFVTHYDYTEGAKHLRSILGFVNRSEMF